MHGQGSGRARQQTGVLTVHLATVVAVIAVAHAAAMNSFSLPIQTDEHQYIAAAALHRGHSLYGDFFYSQTPYFPVVLDYWTRLVTALFGGWGLDPFEAARLLNAVFGGVFLTGFAVLMTRLSGHALVATILVLVVPLSSYMAWPLRFARNDLMPLTLFVLGLLAAVVATQTAFRTANRTAAQPEARRTAMLAWGVAGLFLGIATMTKHSYAFPALALFAHACLTSGPGWRERLTGAALPVAVGGLLGGLPGFFVIAAHFNAFIFSDITFHRTAHVYGMFGVTKFPLTWQLGIMRRVLTDPAMVGMVLTVCGMAIALGRRGLRDLLATDSAERRLLAMLAIMVPALVASFFLARPMHAMYAAPLFVLVAMTLAIVAGRLLSRRPWDGPAWLRPALGLVAVVVALGLLRVVPLPFNNSGNFVLKTGAVWRFDSHRAVSERGSGQRIAGEDLRLRTALDRIRDQMHAALAPGVTPAGLPVAALENGVVLAAGFDLYPTFAGAPFFYRSNDIYPRHIVDRLNGTSPSRVAEWLAANDVEAILVKDEGRLTGGFHAYAGATGMHCFSVDLSATYGPAEGRFYLAPDLAAGPGDCPSPPVPATAGTPAAPIEESGLSPARQSCEERCPS